MQKYALYGGMTLTYGTLISILAEYRSPNDKIVWMIDNGLLPPLKIGLIVSPQIIGIPLSLPLVITQLYGPPYVSMDYALSYYGIIPERGSEVTSMTTKRGKVYELPVGRFSYTHAQPELYSIGIDRVENPDQAGVLVAALEKMLCDKLIFTKNLNVRSQQALHERQFDDLRIDEDALAHFNPEVIRACIAANVKAAMLKALLTLINGLQREAS